MTVQSTPISVRTARAADLPVGVPALSTGVGDAANYVRGELLSEVNRRSTPGTGTVVLTAGARAAQSLEEKLHDNLAALKVATAQVAMHLTREQRGRLFATLDGLMDPAEWPPEQALADRGSFGTYLRMLIHQHPAREPSLGLSDDGHLLAGWVTEADRLTLELLPRDELRWIVTCFVDGKRETAAGVSTLGRLGAVLAPYDPAHWFDHGAPAGHQGP